MIVAIVSRSEASKLPECGGVYAIHNEASGALYIGMARNIRRRYLNWHKAMCRRKEVGRFMLKELETAPANAWRFAILATSETATAAELFALEQQAIRSAMARKVPLLNVGPMRSIRVANIKAAKQVVRRECGARLELYLGFDIPEDQR